MKRTPSGSTSPEPKPARKKSQTGVARAKAKSVRPISFPVPDPSLIIVGALVIAAFGWWFNSRYTLSLQSPFRLHFQSPLVIAERVQSIDAAEAQSDQGGNRLSAWQQYACRKFGSDCRLALAIQRAENPQGKCEIYHYNSNGTLDWGYFQINTIHLQRPGLNLRDLLDCRANIDFAYQLYRESKGFTPWSTFNNGRYLQFYRHP